MTENGVRGMKFGNPPKWKTMTLPHVLGRLPRRIPLVAVVVGRTEPVAVSGWNDTAWQPRSARRRISSAIQSAPSMKPDMAIGMKRPGILRRTIRAMCQSLYVRGHRGHELVVVVLHEELAPDARPRREVHRGQDAVDVHVPDPLVDVVATGADLVEARRVAAPVLRRPALHGVEPEGGDLLALDEPGVGAVGSADTWALGL